MKLDKGNTKIQRKGYHKIYKHCKLCLFTTIRVSQVINTSPSLLHRQDRNLKQNTTIRENTYFHKCAGAGTNDHQLPKYQKIMLPKSLDVDSAHRAIELPCVCHSRQKPFLLEHFQKHKGIGVPPILG